MADPGKLTPKQQRFVAEYLVDLNASAAALRAGYSEKTAGQIGFENLKKPEIATAIAEASLQRSQKTGIDSEWVLTRLGAMFDADIADIVDQDNGTYKPIAEWPEVWRKMLNGLDVRELFEREDGVTSKVGEVVKIRFIDRLKALELIGKHINVNAFQDRVEHSGIPEGQPLIRVEMVPAKGE